MTKIQLEVIEQVGDEITNLSDEDLVGEFKKLYEENYELARGILDLGEEWRLCNSALRAALLVYKALITQHEIDELEELLEEVENG